MIVRGIQVEVPGRVLSREVVAEVVSLQKEAGLSRFRNEVVESISFVHQIVGKLLQLRHQGCHPTRCDRLRIQHQSRVELGQQQMPLEEKCLHQELWSEQAPQRSMPLHPGLETSLDPLSGSREGVPDSQEMSNLGCHSPEEMNRLQGRM